MLKRLQPGAPVYVDGPYGNFILPQGETRPMALIAGATGIAPVRSIVLHMLATKDERSICVLYEPDHRNILYAADFDPLARAGTIVHESGNIEALIRRNRKAIAGATIMAAGFDPFLDRARHALTEIEVDATRMISESFGPEL